MHTIIFW